MSVLFETRLGDIVVDLETELCPTLSLNFLKLCKIYKYNFCSFFNVQRDFIAQTGDPTDQGTGGTSIFGLLPPSDPTKRYFTPELPNPLPSRLKHASTGTLSMAVTQSSTGQPVCASQFFFTLADNLDYLDGKHAVFGRVVEGVEALQQINDTLVDNDGRPLRDIRIRHVVVLEDPFDDPPGLDVPPQSPIPTATQLKSLAVGDEEELPNPLEDEDEAALAAADEERRDREARSQALTLEMIGDLPFHAVRPPENILFVCKLHQVTKSEDLELIFSRFGTILSCEVIRDQKTGDSLQYAFIEFDQKEDAERAYAKMDGVLVDDRRIHVDFSQSVSKLHANWLNKQTTGPKARPSRQGHQPGSGAGRGSKENGYGMVFDMGERDRRERDRDRDRDRDRRGGDRRGGDGRERRDRDDRPFKRERERTRSRSPPRHRDRDRERDRDRRR